MLQYWRVFALTFALMVVGFFQVYGVFSNAGYQPKQPINYSHVLHAGVMGMECLYCHYAAEKGPHAGIPSVDVCMGCHSQVRTDSPEIQKLKEYYDKGEPVPWVRIHKLPDHAFFNHRWHVAAGVACQTCHGPVQNMPVVKQWTKLEMGACMQCHRQDNYVGTIDKTPTYQESAFTEEELAKANHGLSAEQAAAPEYQSALGYIEYYAGAELNATERTALANRLAEYKKDIYYHGRGAQLRGHNASVECSTCHY